MKKTIFALMLSTGLALAVEAQESGAEIGGDAAAVAAENAVKSKDLVTLLKDQLIVADGEETKAAKLEEGMDFYLVYHSASW